MRSPFTWLLDLLYPPKCMICRKILEPDKMPICEACIDALPEHEGANPTVPFAERAVVTFYYEDGLRNSFLRYKFGSMRDYAEQFGKWMAITVGDKLAGRFDLITWVPVSKKRLRSRGFDQSERLARVIGKELGMTPIKLLDKTRHTVAQSALKGLAARKANAAGAYCVARGADVGGKRILLIDDILTTGATLSECCRVLRTAGAASVVTAALATPRDDKER